MRNIQKLHRKIQVWRKHHGSLSACSDCGTSLNNSCKEENKISPPCFSNAEINSPLDSGHFNTKYRHTEDQDYNLAIAKSFVKFIRKLDFKKFNTILFHILQFASRVPSVIANIYLY